MRFSSRGGWEGGVSRAPVSNLGKSFARWRRQTTKEGRRGRGGRFDRCLGLQTNGRLLSRGGEGRRPRVREGGNVAYRVGERDGEVRGWGEGGGEVRVGHHRTWLTLRACTRAEGFQFANTAGGYPLPGAPPPPPPPPPPRLSSSPPPDRLSSYPPDRLSSRRSSYPPPPRRSRSSYRSLPPPRPPPYDEPPPPLLSSYELPPPRPPSRPSPLSPPPPPPRK